jgi:hypothetical protein
MGFLGALDRAFNGLALVEHRFRRAPLGSVHELERWANAVRR